MFEVQNGDFNICISYDLNQSRSRFSHIKHYGMNVFMGS